MPAVDLDRQAIERRDFPIGRRGYDPAAVDAHLRGLAAEFEELQRTAGNGGNELSLASTAGSQVQSIIAAAEAAAADIERQALDASRATRETADRDAQQTREDAIEKARAHAAGVAQAAATLLERVGSMDGEVRTLVESLRAGAGRLASELSALERNMGELYDGASGRGGEAVEPRPLEAAPEEAITGAVASGEIPPQPAVPAAPQAEPEAPAGGADLDSARLIALNMALNGEPRAETERYLAENFQLPDRAKLVEEVYTAIEG
jgi:hypothetical protein